MKADSKGAPYERPLSLVLPRTSPSRVRVGMAHSTSLKRHLDRFLDDFPREEHVGQDPVQFVHRYGDPSDREIVGFVASAFAYGNVKSVLNTVETIVSRMGAHPAEFVTSFDPRRDGRVFRGFQHRWNNQKDLSVLLWILRRLLEEYGSLENALVGDLSVQEPSVERILDAFSVRALGFGHQEFYSKRDLRERRGVRYFFPRTSAGSACKRLNLFLRWMVRPDDGVDCGVWSRIGPHHLVIPLDTHIARISGYIGLSTMHSPGWKMAVEITDALRCLDGSDPLRYDFALCHLGIAGDCPRRRDPLKCIQCPIEPVCLL
jgi:uncharacterized protein (TIGR02757 family)